jgi:hypothetical protein
VQLLLPHVSAAEPLVSQAAAPPALQQEAPPAGEEREHQPVQPELTPRDLTSVQEPGEREDDAHALEDDQERACRYPLRSRMRAERALVAASDLPPEPKSYAAALRGPEREQWQGAVESELKSLLENGTWELVPRPHGVKVLPSFWVFTRKTNPDGSIARWKGRVVVDGSKQTEGVDYNEVFAPTLATLHCGFSFPMWLRMAMC